MNSVWQHPERQTVGTSGNLYVPFCCHPEHSEKSAVPSIRDSCRWLVAIAPRNDKAFRFSIQLLDKSRRSRLNSQVFAFIRKFCFLACCLHISLISWAQGGHPAAPPPPPGVKTTKRS